MYQFDDEEEEERTPLIKQRQRAKKPLAKPKRPIEGDRDRTKNKRRNRPTNVE